jgi:hypothetical protein
MVCVLGASMEFSQAELANQTTVSLFRMYVAASFVAAIHAKLQISRPWTCFLF